MREIHTGLFYTISSLVFLLAGCSHPRTSVAWPLKVSPDARYLVDQHGSPFFIHAETAWKLMNAQTRENMDLYLDNCVDNGFNTVFFVFRPFQGTSDAYGNLPFEDDDISSPYEAFWANVDSLVDKALKREMLLFGVMLWQKDDQNAVDGNRRNPLKYTREQCRKLGRFLGERYHPDKGRGNIIFVGGGDKRPGSDTAKYTAMAEALLEQNPNALITYHAYHPSSSCDQWGYPGWLSINGIYNYQPPHSPQWVWQEAHNNWREHGSEMPIMLYEGLYENESRRGYGGTPANIRKQHWWAITSGCTAGHAIGHRNIWTMNDWKAHLGDEARTDMKHLRNLMESLDWWKREPDVENVLLVGGLGPEENRATACMATDRSYAILFSPNQEDPVVDLTLIKGSKLGQWFNPRSGEIQEVDMALPESGIVTFSRPDTLEWVLVLKTR